MAKCASIVRGSTSKSSIRIVAKPYNSFVGTKLATRGEDQIRGEDFPQILLVALQRA